MHQNRPDIVIPDILQNRQQVIDIVSIDRPNIINAKLLEQSSARPEIAGEFLGLAGTIINEFGKMASKLFCRFAHGTICAARDKPGEIGRQGSCWWSDRHVIVVENDDEA